MNTDKNNTANQAKPTMKVSRRSFVKAGSIAAPVLMTLASRPAFAACTVSGFASATPENISGTARHGAEICGATGNETFWINNPGSWPAPYNSATSKVKDLFTLQTGWNAENLIMDVLTGAVAADGVAISSLIAAMFNAKSGGYSVLESQVDEMYSDLFVGNYDNNGLLSPSWDAATVDAFLQETFAS